VNNEELARAEHENYIAAFAAVARAQPDGEVLRMGRVAILASGLPAAIFNVVTPEGAIASETDLLRAVDHIRNRGVPFVVQLVAGAHDHLVAVLGDLDVAESHPEHPMPGMVLHPLPAMSSQPPGGLEITEVRSDDEMEAAAGVMVDGFGMPLSLARDINRALTAGDGLGTGYIGYADGRPVATSVGFRTGHTIGVYNVTTIRAARRRGYGDAMTRRVIVDGAFAGCEAAALQSSDVAFPMYSRMGFRTVIRYRRFVPAQPL
jgi:hypothetical protein